MLNESDETLSPRPVRSEDVPGILDLIGAVFREYDCVLDAVNEDRHLLDPGDYFRSRGGEFWVVEESGTVLATVGVLIHAGAAELKSLYVAPAVRRQGWGRRLVLIVEDFARRQGHTRLILWSDTRFLAAHGLYRAMDYRQCGCRDLHDSNASVEFGFEKALE